MKADQLHDLWASPDNTRLTSKQFSFRLPVHIAAKIAALCEMYPQKNRTHIVADLLTSALDELEKKLPEEWAPLNEEELNYLRIGPDGEDEDGHQLGGPRGRFRNISNRQYIEMEKELGNENPEPLFEKIYVTEAHMKAKKS